MHVSNSPVKSNSNILKNENCTDDALVVDYSDFSRITLFAKYIQLADQAINMVHDDSHCDEMREQRANYFVDDTVSPKAASIFNDYFNSLSMFTDQYSGSFNPNTYKAGKQYLLTDMAIEGYEEHDLSGASTPRGEKGGIGYSSKYITDKLFNSKLNF